MRGNYKQDVVMANLNRCLLLGMNLQSLFIKVSSPLPEAYLAMTKVSVVPRASTPPDALGLIDVGTIAQGHLGSSSSAWFSNQLRDLVNTRQHSPNAEAHKQWSATKLSDLDPARLSSSHGPTLPLSSLPPRLVADQLLTHFWQRSSYGIPILDKDAFGKSYEALWEGVELNTDVKMFECTLNMMFALSSQDMSDKSHTERLEDGLLYFNRARAMLRFDIFSG